MKTMRQEAMESPRAGTRNDAAPGGRGGRAGEPLRVLYLDNTFTFGGAINSLLHMLRGFRPSQVRPVVASGHAREFVSGQVPGSLAYQVPIRLQWVHDRWFQRVRRVIPFRRGPVWRLVTATRVGYWFFFNTLPEALRYVAIGRRHGVQLVHLNNSVRSQPAGVLAAKLLGVPCVVHTRGFQWANWSITLRDRMISRHIAISTAVRDSLVAAGIDGSKVDVVFDAIDLDEFDDEILSDGVREEFGVRPGDLTFGLFGRIVDWKGTLEFVQAVAHVVRQFPHARAFIVGDVSDGAAEYGERVLQCIRELGIERNVTLTGYRRDVPQLMKMMDVVVHASTSPEPFGMVLIEGMAMNKPIVATEGGGPDDVVVPGVTGLIVPRRDTGAMGEAIVELLKNPAVRESMGRAGRERVVAHFAKERYAAQVLGVYQRVLGTHGASSVADAPAEYAYPV